MQIEIRFKSKMYKSNKTTNGHANGNQYLLRHSHSVFAGSLEAAYSLNWGAQKIW